MRSRCLRALCLLPASLSAALNYHVDDFCFPYDCYVSGVNNSGVIIGNYQLSFGSDSHGFIYDRKRGLVPLDPGDGDLARPSSINEDGVVVGDLYASRRGFAWLPVTGRFLRLPSVNALHINNRGDITGDSGGPAPQLIPSFQLTSLSAIADDGAIIGTAEHFPDYFGTATYSPNSSPLLLPECICRTNGGYFNNRGQVVVNATYVVSQTPYTYVVRIVLYTPGAGVRVLPVPATMRVHGISSSGLLYLVDSGTDENYLYEPSGAFDIGTEPVRVQDLLPADSGWTLGTDWGFTSSVNDSGEFLVYARHISGRQTYVRLVPDENPAPRGSSLHTGRAIPRRTPSVLSRSGCESLTFNSAPVCEVDR